MNIEKKATQGLENTFLVTLPSAEIETRIQTWLANRQKSVKMDGFRPGKVPFSVLQQRYGDQARQDVLERYVDESSKKIVLEHKLKPAGNPIFDITNSKDGEDFVFNITFENLPTFDVKDFSGIKLDRLIHEVADEDADEDLARLVEMVPTYKKAAQSHKSESKNLVVFDMECKLGGKILKDFTSKDLRINLGEQAEGLEYIHEAMLGKKAGEEIQFNHTFGKDFQDSKLAGNEASFIVNIKEIQISEPSKLDEDFAKKLGYVNLEELKAARRSMIQQDRNRLAHFYHKRKILDILSDQYDFDLPTRMVDQEFNAIWKKFQEELAQGKEDGTAEDDAGKSEDDYKKEYREIAERRVRLGILIAEIAHKNNITVTEQLLARVIMEEAKKYPGQERAVVDYYRTNAQAREGLKSPAIEDMVIDFILNNAKVNEVKVDFAQLKSKLSGIVPGFEEEGDENSEGQKKKSSPSKKNSAKSSK